MFFLFYFILSTVLQLTLKKHLQIRVHPVYVEKFYYFFYQYFSNFLYNVNIKNM